MISVDLRFKCNTDVIIRLAMLIDVVRWHIIEKKCQLVCILTENITNIDSIITQTFFLQECKIMFIYPVDVGHSILWL